MVKKRSNKRKISYIKRLRQREKVRSKQYAGWRKQFESSYISRLRSRKRSKSRNQKGGSLFLKKKLSQKKPNCPPGESRDAISGECRKKIEVYGNMAFSVEDKSQKKKVIQNGGFSLKSSLTKMKKAFTNLKNDIILIFTSKKSLETKYKNDPEKVIELIKRRTKVRNKALIISAILAVTAGGKIVYNKRRKAAKDAKDAKEKKIKDQIKKEKKKIKKMMLKKHLKGKKAKEEWWKEAMRIEKTNDKFHGRPEWSKGREERYLNWEIKNDRRRGSLFAENIDYINKEGKKAQK